MEMQDVDYELIYEPGKDEADPLDFLSRHPLPTTEQDDTEMSVKQVLQAEHAIVMKDIKRALEKDVQLQDVIQRILKND